MAKPFMDGWELIRAGRKREDEEFLRNVYYHGTVNGLNMEYETYSEFKRAIQVSSPEKTKTKDEIMAEVKNILDSFH